MLTMEIRGDEMTLDIALDVTLARVGGGSLVWLLDRSLSGSG
jgi:hypothetical protein